MHPLRFHFPPWAPPYVRAQALSLWRWNMFKGPLPTYTHNFMRRDYRDNTRRRAYMPATIVIARCLVHPTPWCRWRFPAVGQGVNGMSATNSPFEDGKRGIEEIHAPDIIPVSSLLKLLSTLVIFSVYGAFKKKKKLWRGVRRQFVVYLYDCAVCPPPPLLNEIWTLLTSYPYSDDNTASALSWYICTTRCIKAMLHIEVI